MPTSLLPGALPARRRLRAVRRQLLLRRRLVAALLTGVAVLAGLRAVSPEPGATVVVPTAARDLSGGEVLGADDVALIRVAPDRVPDGVADDAVGRVLASPVRRGEALTDVRLVGPSLAQAHPGLTVLPVRLPDEGMASLLHPGDRVTLLATDPGTGDAQRLADDALVVAVPSSAPAGPVGGNGGALVVLGLAPEVALDVTGASLGQYLTVAWSR